MEWWAYLHINGSIQLKRFLRDMGGWDSVHDAEESPFVQKVMQPFKATTHEDAERKAKEYFNV